MLYRAVRNTYQRALNREHWEERQRIREFFRPWVNPGDLVFDVGAHRGHYAETFRELGARVVAVEPDPQLAGEIGRHFPGIHIVQAAVGAQNGQAELRIGQDTAHSTLSDDWAARMPDRWTDTITVPVTTLDTLIFEHGDPAFVKIDVEGFEADAVNGLSRPVRALMFEYLADLPDVTRLVIARLERLGPYRFRFGDQEGWTDGEGVVAGLYGRDGSGDVMAQHL